MPIIAQLLDLLLNPGAMASACGKGSHYLVDLVVYLLLSSLVYSSCTDDTTDGAYRSRSSKHSDIVYKTRRAGDGGGFTLMEREHPAEGKGNRIGRALLQVVNHLRCKEKSGQNFSDSKKYIGAT